MKITIMNSNNFNRLRAPVMTGVAAIAREDISDASFPMLLRSPPSVLYEGTRLL
jgi:hypothetical protein